MSAKKARILIGLTNIAGNSTDLCSGFRELGHQSDFIGLKPHPFHYAETKPDNPFLLRIIHALNPKAEAAGQKPTTKNIWKLLRKLTIGALFLQSLFKYDVFIFYCNVTFFNTQMDLPILKLLKKKIIIIYVGSDARPRYLDGAIRLGESYQSIGQLNQMVKSQKKHIAWAEKYADYSVCLPPLAHFFKRKIISFAFIGLPRQVKAPKLEIKVPEAESIKILHAPSDPKFKGTEVIRQAIKSLKNKGYAIIYTEMLKQPNRVVLENISACDFVVDQVYSETSMAGLAVEAAFLGKPSVVGGYYADSIHQDLPPDIIAPSAYVHPSKIEEAIEKLIVDKKYREELGLKAQAYAQKYLKPWAVAARLARLINNDVPPEWYYDPNKVTYLNGGGYSEDQVKELLARVMREGGPEALQLSDKPELEKAFVELVRN